MSDLQVNEEIARKVLGAVDAGLVMGLGIQEPGKMCVEAAVCFAYGLPHSDRPPCVGSAVRGFKIRLNDSRWSSNEVRAAGMRKLAIAQLGSDSIDQRAFAKLVAEGSIRRIVPIALRAAAKRIPAHSAAMEAAAVRCEQEGTTEAAKNARAVARAAAAAAAADAYAAADAAAYADAYADAAVDAAADAARDQVLMLAADIGLQALIELKSPGCEYLFLTETQQ